MSVTGKSACFLLKLSVHDFGRPDQGSQMYWPMCPDGLFSQSGGGGYYKMSQGIDKCGPGLPPQGWACIDSL